MFEQTELMGIQTSTTEYLENAHKHLRVAEVVMNKKAVMNAMHLRMEDASAAFVRAAEAFKICEMYQESADSYAKAADVQLRLGCPSTAASLSSSAAETMTRANPGDSIVFYRNAISLLCEVGRFGTAGRIQRKLAEFYEEDRNFEDCIDQYRMASDYYLGDGDVQMSDLCLVKCGYYLGLMEEFDDSAEIYSSVGLRCLDSNLLRFNARTHFLHSCLVHLAGGSLHHPALKRNLMKFKTGDPSFAFCRECLFIENLLAIHEASDIHVFADHVYNFENVSHLDSWCLEMLYELRNQVQVGYEKKTKEAQDEKVRVKVELEEEKRIKAEEKAYTEMVRLEEEKRRRRRRRR